MSSLILITRNTGQCVRIGPDLHPGTAFPQPWSGTGLCLLTCLQPPPCLLGAWIAWQCCFCALLQKLKYCYQEVVKRGNRQVPKVSHCKKISKNNAVGAQVSPDNSSWGSLKGYCLKCTAKEIVCGNILWRDPLKHHCDKGRKIPPGADLWLCATPYSQKHGSYSNKTSFSAKPFMYFS